MANPDCKKAEELMSGAIDNELSPEEFSYFNHHIESCETCKNKFELERLTQSFFKDKVKLMDSPADLRQKVRSRLSEVDRIQLINIRRHQLIFRRYLWPVVGIAAVFILAIVTLFTKKANNGTVELSHQSPVSTEITAPQFSQTKDALESSQLDFQNLLNGKFIPQIKSNDVDNVDRFITENAGYSIPLPIIHDVEWIGGSVASLETQKVVRVAYKMGLSYLYIYAFPTLLAHSNAVTLSLKCIKALDGNNWYWDERQNGNLQVVWKYKNRVCVATSNLSRKDLTTYLKTLKGVTEGWQ